MSIATMAHLGYAPPQVLQIDPSLLAISPYIDPLPSITANATSPPPPPKKLKRKAAEGKERDPDKPKKPRKKPVRTPRPKSASPTNGDGAEALLPIGALAAANTLGRHTKLASKCSRHTRIPKPSSALEVEAHRLHRLVKILSARCATREAVLATQLGRAPRPVPTLADVPIPPPPPVQLPPLPKSSKRGKQQTDKSQRGGGGGGEQQQPRDDIVVDFQAYNDYCNRHSANQESILEDAQALLSLAADPIKSGTGSPFFVDDNVDPGQAIGGGVGVGLEISAAAAVAAAQAARQPRPFSQFTTSSATTAQRPPLPRSATMSALLHNGGVPTPPYAAPTDNNGAAVITATQIEAYRSLAAQMGLDLNAAGGGSPDPYEGADQAFDSSAFEPVMESTVLPLPLPPAPLYYLPPPIPSAPAATAETTRSASASTATFFYPTLGPSSPSSQLSDPNAIANAAAQQRRRQDPEWLSEREARHRARFDRAAKEALTQQQQDEEPVSQRANASGGLFRSQGYGYGRAHDHNKRDDDPMLLAPIETTRNLQPQQPPSLPSLPARRSSWLLSPVLDPLSLSVPPSACSSSSSSMQQQQQQQQRPHLSIDAAGAFAQTFREANPLSGSGASGAGGGGGGGAISALFWRGLPSAATPLRSAFAATAGGGGTTPLGTSKIRFWQDVVVDSPDRENDDHDDDDDNDERFEPRPAGGNAAADHSLMMMAASGGGGGVLDEWERFQPRAANQTERTAADLTVVEEREPEEQEPEEKEQEQEEGGGDGGEEEPRKDGSAAGAAAAAAEQEKELVASRGSPAAAVSVGAMDAEAVADEGSVEVEVAVAVDGGGSTAATVGVGN
ncbi:hypothetical protein RHOSPDRAFT_35608 [Rhodotorula sp. JG-1b]|nr:hypothetical protein RHOSPDRAFT_35608 [Rhodotorula sp. JG-1b]